jgi:hypothetical protein
MPILSIWHNITAMKFFTTLIAVLVSSAAATPAIVWSSEEGSIKHSSEVIDAKTVISSATAGAYSSVVFVVGRDEHGSEGLTGLTSSGALPNVAGKYADASAVHHYVRGVETFDSLSKDAQASNAKVVKSSLKEFKNRDAGDNAAAELFIVSVPADHAPADIDAAISSAIDDSKVGSVVLTAVRGLSEVKLERDVNARKQFREMQQQANRRKLEDANNGDDNGDSQDGVYFVNFTPNIFSGLLFFFFFTITTYVGIGCMGSIAGQDVYVTKYPTIGREA